LRASLASCFAVRWFSSQNCPTRESVSRRKTRLPGFLQSVKRMGSQTVKTVTLASRFRFKTFWTAEAPRRQVVQVGERRTMTRTFSEA